MNWAIIPEGSIDPVYIQGTRVANEVEAEAEWRRITDLHFLPVTVRRTTTIEDRRLT